MPNLPWILVEDYRRPVGWARAEERDARSRAYCELLERGQILFFREPPFDLPFEDRKFLLAQEWAELRLHKNVSYRPAEDISEGCNRRRRNSRAVALDHAELLAQVIELPDEVSRALRREMDSRFFELSSA